jgi:hypothetical protein
VAKDPSLCPRVFTFTGHGKWTDTAQWANQNYPGRNINKLDRVMIGNGLNPASCLLDSSVSFGAGAVLQVSAKGTFTLDSANNAQLGFYNTAADYDLAPMGGLVVDSLGTAFVHANIFAYGSAISNKGTLTVRNKTIYIRHVDGDAHFKGSFGNNGNLYNYGTIDVEEIASANEGFMYNKGLFKLDPGFVEAGSFDNSGILVNDGIMSGHEGRYFLNGNVINNGSISGDYLTVAGYCINKGNLIVSPFAGGRLTISGSLINNGGTSTSENLFDVSITGSVINNGSFNCSKTLSEPSSTDLLPFTISGRFTNNGTMNLLESNLIVSGQFTNTKNVSVRGQSTFSSAATVHNTDQMLLKILPSLVNGNNLLQCPFINKGTITSWGPITVGSQLINTGTIEQKSILGE